MSRRYLDWETYTLYGVGALLIALTVVGMVALAHKKSDFDKRGCQKTGEPKTNIVLIPYPNGNGGTFLMPQNQISFEYRCPDNGETAWF